MDPYEMDSIYIEIKLKTSIFKLKLKCSYYVSRILTNVLQIRIIVFVIVFLILIISIGKKIINKSFPHSIYWCMYLKYSQISQFQSILIDSSMDNKVTNGASNEQNSCENISHMIQKNTADDQKQQWCTKRKFELTRRICQNSASIQPASKII